MTVYKGVECASIWNLVKDQNIRIEVAVTITVVLRIPCYSLLLSFALLAMIGGLVWKIYWKNVQMLFKTVLLIFVMAHLVLYSLID